ncbi:MAG: O-antigen polymerase [Candidatus Sulfotelmatobacter sp.]
MSSLLAIVSSAWLPTAFVAALALYLRARSGSWLAPSSFLGLVWSCYLPVSLLAVDHPLPGLGIWALLSLIVAVQIGSLVAEATAAEHSRNAMPAAGFSWEEGRRIRRSCWLVFLTALAGCAYFVYGTLRLFDQSFTFASLIQMASRWTLLRYDEFFEPWPMRLAAIWAYPAALLGGVWFGISCGWRDKSLGLLSLLPCLLITFLTGGRAAFLVGLACWLGGSWSGRVVRLPGAAKLLSRGTLLCLAALAGGLLLFFVAVNTFRGAGNATDTRDFALDFNSPQIRNYMFGPPAAFVDWFDHDDRGPHTWGARTFPGLYDLLRIQRRTMGTYLDSANTVGTEGTNIFTMFRGLVEDFTLPGAFLVCGFWGYSSARAYSRHSAQAIPLLSLAAYYAVALFSPLYCLFSFNSSVFAWVVAWLVLRQKAGESLTA